MRFLRPSPAMVVAIVAIVVATAGTAFAATGQLVNIVDPSDSARAAKVGSTGKLHVGDGSGPLTVDGTTTSHEAPPSAFVRSRAIAASGGCIPIFTAPADKAIVVKTLLVDTYVNPSPSQLDYIAIHLGTDCGSNVVLFDSTTTVGLESIPLDPGVAVPAGQSLSVRTSGDLRAEVYGMGYTVPAGAVPAAAAPAKRDEGVRKPGD